LAEFYDNAFVTEGKVSSTVNGVELQKKVKAHVIDEVGSSTFMACGFELFKEVDSGLEQGVQTPAPPVSSSGLFIASIHQKHQRIEADFVALKELSTKRHEDLFSLFFATLNAKLTPPAP